MLGNPFSRCVAATALAMCLAVGVNAQTADQKDAQKEAKKLTIGDKAPPIDIAHWLKGVEMDRAGSFTPITKFEKDKVYVLEFWATWCGPCVGSMPHLSELQEKYEDYDVTIIGVSDETLPKVMEFLFKKDKRDGKLHNERTRYTLTTDPDESVKNDYFRAAGRRGIPCSFIIGKDSRVEWIGHPMSMDEPLDAVVRDTWDRAAFKKDFETARKREKIAEQAASKIRAARRAGDWDVVLGAIDEALAKAPGDVNMMMQKFTTLLADMNEPKRAYPIAEDIIAASWEDPMMLNAVSWFVVDNRGVKTRDLDLAMRAANRATELAKNENPAILDTVARVHYEKGDLASAVKWQRMAADKAGDDQMGAEIRETLEKYEKASKKGY